MQHNSGKNFFLTESSVNSADARLAGDWFFTGPISGFIPESGEIPGDPDQQVEQLFINLQNLLDQAGISTDAIGHMMVWQKDRGFREPLNKLWEAWFPDPKNRPARHVVVRDWKDDALIKIEVIAIAGQRRETIIDMPGASLGGGANRGFIPLACVLGDVLFTGAMAGWDLRTGLEADEPEDQTKFIFSNMKALLDIAGFSMADIGHAFVWQREQRYHSFVNDNLEKYYPNVEDRPAEHSIQVDLPLTLATQLEVIAIHGKQRTNTLKSIPHKEWSDEILPISTTLENIMFSFAFSGTVEEGNSLPENIVDEVGTVFENVREGLYQSGFKADQVVHVYVWKSSDEWDDIIDEQYNLLWSKADLVPVRHDVKVKLPRGMKVQLEIIAVKE